MWRRQGCSPGKGAGPGDGLQKKLREEEVPRTTPQSLACVTGGMVVPSQRSEGWRSRAEGGLGGRVETLWHPKDAVCGRQVDVQVWGLRLHDTGKMPFLLTPTQAASALPQLCP